MNAACEQAYAALTAAGKEPLLDDSDERPGAKFATMDLIGLPWQLVIGPKGLKDGVVELKRRDGRTRPAMESAEGALISLARQERQGWRAAR